MTTELFRILLAEDDKDDRFFFAEAFAGKKEIEISACPDGVALLAELRRHHHDDDIIPNVIVLDQNMPRLNGIETLHLLKADDFFCDIPVVIYSTYTDDNLRKKGICAGAILVLEKPYDKIGYENMLGEIRNEIEKSAVRSPRSEDDN